jgi:hypothetical protein
VFDASSFTGRSPAVKWISRQEVSIITGWFTRLQQRQKCRDGLPRERDAPRGAGVVEDGTRVGLAIVRDVPHAATPADKDCENRDADGGTHNVRPITGRAGAEPRSTDRNYTPARSGALAGYPAAAPP